MPLTAKKRQQGHYHAPVDVQRFQVVVIGGGHAGVEAAWGAASLLGAGGTREAPAATVALVSIDPSKIGVMSCNPAIGGLAKGQLVREIDALHGLMGLATDATGIQFKVLNRSKGSAVHGPRAQCDKHAYAERVQALIAQRPEIQILAGTVEELVVERDAVRGVIVAGRDGTRTRLDAQAIVLTTGTFMRGLMHTGETKTPGGRFGEAAAAGISGALSSLGFELGRLKTGTPPRLKRGTIRWEELEPALGDADPLPFSDVTGEMLKHGRDSRTTREHSTQDRTAQAETGNRFPVMPQVECRQTQTTAAAHELIRANLHRAPMYSGQIESAGPRYCPSIEDKVVRFADRDVHGVFLEPESLRDDWIYCNGISTSLPADVQDAIVRSMPGCEAAEVYRYGYAVEYDMVRPHQIHASGMTKRVQGLFLAGQINGTSGYEEAAAQGLIAGVNAARHVLGKQLWICGREDAYLGVLMDDLVTKTPVEPYRMFTSRAEHRLLLRAGNAGDRLTPLAERLGLMDRPIVVDGVDITAARRGVRARRATQATELHARIHARTIDGKPLAKWILSPTFEMTDLKSAIAGEDEGRFEREVWEAVLAERKYEPYVEKQRLEIERRAEMEHRRLPETTDYRAMSSMRTEAREALARFRPATFGQAGRLEGITPADLTLLSVLLRKADRDGRDPRPTGLQ